MPKEMIEEQVDIYKLPVAEQPRRDKGAITIGDLHGNSMKLMFLLVKHGIATNLSTDDYQLLVGIYKKSPHLLTAQDLDTFNGLLGKIHWNPELAVRLIGDELADRGSNDYFTLKILEQLNKNKVPFEVIVSNHSIEFIDAYEQQDGFGPRLLNKDEHAPSMRNLDVLIRAGLVTKQEIDGIVDTAYKPNLKALSYSLSADKKEITLYSHAGVGLQNIKSLAKLLGVGYRDHSAEALALTIDHINVVFQKHVANNSLHTLYSLSNLRKGYVGYADLRSAPLEFIMWNRLYRDGDQDFLYRPQHHPAGFDVDFVHGHDSGEVSHDNIVNLDNLLGKGSGFNKGVYSVLPTPEGLPQKIATKEQGHPTIEFEVGLFHRIAKMERKVADLENRGHAQAASAARAMVTSIESNYWRFKSREIEAPEFKQNCKTAIDGARGELEPHRGWKKILGNLGLFILGLGVGYALAGLVNLAVTGNFLFFQKTASIKRMELLEKEINSLDPKDAPKM
jgi:hypothetical protein